MKASGEQSNILIHAFPLALGIVCCLKPSELFVQL